MKRDMLLMHAILEEIEKTTEPRLSVRTFLESSEFNTDEENVLYHLRMMADEGLIYYQVPDPYSRSVARQLSPMVENFSARFEAAKERGAQYAADWAANAQQTYTGKIEPMLQEAIELGHERSQQLLKSARDLFRKTYDQISSTVDTARDTFLTIADDVRKSVDDIKLSLAAEDTGPAITGLTWRGHDLLESGALQDGHTHRASWLKAFDELAQNDDPENASYWKHEQKALARFLDEFAPGAKPVQAQRSELELN